MKPGPSPVVTDVVGRCGRITIGLADYDRALLRMTLFSPGGADVAARLPDRLLGAPHFQHGTVMDLLNIHLIREEAASRGITITDEEVVAQLDSEAVGLSRYAEMSVESREADLKARGLTMDDLVIVGRDRLLVPRLREALVPAIEEEALWSLYVADKEKVALDLVKIPNTPSSTAITTFVRANPDKVSNYYKENPQRFTLPTSRRARMILKRLGRDYTASDEAKAREALEAILKRAAGGESFEKLAREASDHGSAASGGDLGWVILKQTPEAFKAPVGKISSIMRTGEGLAIFLAEEERVSALAPLSNTVKREIAAELIRAAGVTPEAAAKANAVLEAWKKDGRAGGASLEAVLKTHRLRRQTTPTFAPDNPRGFVPGVGLSRPIANAASQLTLSRWLVPRPMLHQNTVYVIALASKEVASRDVFGQERAALEARALRMKREAAMVATLERSRSACDARVELAPVVKKYGRLEKPAP